MGCAGALRPDGARELRRLGAPRRFRGKRLLDVGTGDGRLAIAAAPFVARALGIDPDPEAIARATERARGLAHVEFRVGDAQSLAIRATKFDIAIFSWSL